MSLQKILLLKVKVLQQLFSERTSSQLCILIVHFDIRDIGGSDPERMAAPRVAEYVREMFEGTLVKVEVMEGQANFEKHYPCLAAVNRAANSVPRHQVMSLYSIWVLGNGQDEGVKLLKPPKNLVKKCLYCTNSFCTVVCASFLGMILLRFYHIILHCLWI